MARKAMIEKSKRKPKFAGAAAQPLRSLRPLARLPAPLRSLPHLLPRAVAVRDDPGRAEGELVDVERRRSTAQPSVTSSDRHTSHSSSTSVRIREDKESLMSMTDPIADMLTRIRNACGSKHRRVDMPVSKMKTEIARILKENNFIQDYTTSRPRRASTVLRVRSASTPAASR